MKHLPKEVISFRVIVLDNWICEVSDLPQPDETPDSIAQGESCESYIGETDDYTVEVHRNIAETTVMVFNKSNNEITDFEIDNIVVGE